MRIKIIGAIFALVLSGTGWCTSSDPVQMGARALQLDLEPASPQKVTELNFPKDSGWEKIEENGRAFVQFEIQNSELNIRCIKFPVDGSQPTTQEAAEWSCANVDNEAVTFWYMEMFGLPLENGDFLEMGFAPLGEDAQSPKCQNPRAIINFDESFDNEKKEKFWFFFMEIASNPIGRVLLYRLLIEIRRQDAQGIGAEEVGIKLGNSQKKLRNNLRSITLTFGKPSFNCAKSAISLNQEERSLPNIALENNQEVPVKQFFKIYTGAKRPLEVALFHEMLHWFHCLRNYLRAHEETGGSVCAADIKNYIFKAYYGNVPPESPEWEPKAKKCEEIRTILGTPLPDSGCAFEDNSRAEWKYCEGDDLSDNAYRISIDQPMRWGHVEGFTKEMIWYQSPRTQIANAIGLARTTALNCYKNITGNEPLNWVALEE